MVLRWTTAVLLIPLLGCGENGIHIGTVPLPLPDASADSSGQTMPVAPCVATSDLVVHFPFDESGGQAVIDMSSSGGDGSLVNMAAEDWVPGPRGNALDFDGEDDHVRLPRGDHISDLGAMTMCAWINPRSFPNEYPTIADKSLDTYEGGWNFYLENHSTFGPVFGFLTNERKWATAGGIVLNRWQHVCASWDGSPGFSGIRLYHNGFETAEVEAESNGDVRDSDAERDLLIGRVNDGSHPFDGLIDDYRLYDRVLTPTETESVYRCSSGAP